MDVKFGTKRGRATDPKVPYQRGMPGDYLGLDSLGVYTVLTEKQFLRLFPIPNQNPPHNPCTDKELRDPKFLTDVIQKQTAATSNTQYGTSYKSAPKAKGKKKLSGIKGLGKPPGTYK